MKSEHGGWGEELCLGVVSCLWHSVSMKLIPPPENVAFAGLRALRTVALCDGEMHDIESAFLESVQKHILHTSYELDELNVITPEELADVVTEPEFVERLVRALVFVALIDGEASEEEDQLVGAYAKALKADRAPVRELHRIAHHRLGLLRLDIARRGFIGERGKQHLARKGFRGFVEAMRAITGRETPSLAEKYRALREYPDGTLGREYARFIDANEFAFPGEVGGPPEPIVFHDCVHVLAEYGTSAEEEVQVVAFQAGAQSFDPFFSLMFVFAQFHLGIQISPIAGVDTEKIDPDTFLEAFVRGTKCTRDPTSDWDPWEDFENPLPEVRAAFGVAPR